MKHLCLRLHSKAQNQQHCHLQWAKTEYWEASGPHPWLPKEQRWVSYGEQSAFLIRPRVGEHVHSFLWQKSFQHQNWGLFSQTPREPPDEGSRSRTQKSGYIHVKCGPLYCSWKVESWCISGSDPKQGWRPFSTECSSVICLGFMGMWCV